MWNNLTIVGLLHVLVTAIKNTIVQGSVVPRVGNLISQRINPYHQVAKNCSLSNQWQLRMRQFYPLDMDLSAG